MRSKTAGCKLFIGTAAVTIPTTGAVDATFFDTVTWEPVGELTDLGELGDSAEEITADIINRGRRVRSKGTKDAGMMNVTALSDSDDTGQEAMIDAEGTDNDWPFKIELTDAPEGGTPSQRLFAGVVMSTREAFGTANNFVTRNLSIGVNTNIVRVAPAPAVP